MTREEWLAAVSDLLVRRYGVSLADFSLTDDQLTRRYERGDGVTVFAVWLAVRYRLKPLPEDGSQDRPASDGGSEDGEAARSDLNNKTSFPKGMPRD
jgi:hypothetical protein